MKHIIFALFTIFLYIGNSFASADPNECSIKIDNIKDLEDVKKHLENEYHVNNALSQIFDDLQEEVPSLKDTDFINFLKIVAKNPSHLKALTFFIEEHLKDKPIYKDFIKNTADMLKKAIDKSNSSQPIQKLEGIMAYMLQQEHKKAIDAKKELEEDGKKFQEYEAKILKDRKDNKGKTASILTGTVTNAVQQYLTHKNSQNRMLALRALQERETAILNRAARSQAMRLGNKVFNEFDFHDPIVLQEAPISELVEAKNRIDTHINNLDQQKAANIMKRKQLMQQRMAEEQGLNALSQKLQSDLASTEESLKASFEKAKRVYDTYVEDGHDGLPEGSKARLAMEMAQEDYESFMASKKSGAAQNMINAELAKAQASSQLGNIDYELSRIDTDNSAIETQIISLNEVSSTLDPWISKKKRASKREIREKEQEEKLRKDAVYAQKSYVPQATRVGTISNGRGTTRTYSKVRGSVR